MRFRNPLGGVVSWDDAVKGTVEISNEELDDLVIARPDGTPTYNFCVVVDDLDMQITHVIRGDDHVNNTPRQINILRALGGEVPVYAHLPTVLNEQGEKMSKRHGAMSVTGYRDAGYLPEAVVNYLARLGWSHGDAEIFSREQFVEWFDLDHLGKSPAQYDHDKLNWLNAHYIKEADNARLATLAKPFLTELGIDAAATRAGRAARTGDRPAEGPRVDGEGNRRERRDVLPGAGASSRTLSRSTSPTRCARRSPICVRRSQNVEWTQGSDLGRVQGDARARTSSRCRNSRCRCVCWSRARLIRRRSMRC